MTRVIAAALALCLWAAGAAPSRAADAPTWRIDAEKSTLAFFATQVGQRFTGRFARFSADLTLDPADLAGARLTATVDLASVDAGDRQRNEALPGKDWFDTAAHPKATFRSESFAAKGGRNFEVTGVLRLKGIERRVTIPFTLTPIGDSAAIKGGFTLTRTDFGVGAGQWATGQWVGLDVAVAINAVAARVRR
ncbi:MAG: YceI family protein [Sphingomonadales bacterium]